MSQLVLPGLLPPPAAPDPLPFGAPSPLIHYPDIPGSVRANYAKRLGAAGERLVDSYLIRWGFHLIEAPESEPYDRMIFVNDDLLRLQIKTVTHAVSGAFRFSMEQGYRKSPGGRHQYQSNAFDLAALVILPENVVRFSAEPRRCHRIPASEIAYLRRKPQASFLDAIAAYRERRALGA
ncbi:hypothetical protein ACTTAL_07215 [Rhodobacter capsulatus]|uniref:hypothetical protein n=1 Tax=Rhodobacter capsulatus TaxID=1061 RepID=UPI00103A7ED3|nr:hypothetical protein [Rhodobacter capsulatus]